MWDVRGEKNFTGRFVGRQGDIVLISREGQNVRVPLARLSNDDQQYVVKVDPHIKTDVTAIIGCAVMTGAGAVINSAKVQPGQSVAIFGVGGVGLSAVVGAKVAGARAANSSP